MTREEFVDWLTAHDCKPVPIEGSNVTGWAIKFINPKTDRHFYIQTPINEKEMPDYTICHACQVLGIPIPDCVQHEDERYNKIKDRYGRH